MARKKRGKPASKPSPQYLRWFRTSVSKLKKAGLINPTVDARSVKPTKTYKDLVAEYRGVIEGKQRTVKLPRSKLAIAKEDGKEVRRDRVIIDNNPGMRIIHDKDDPYGYRILHPKSGYEMIEHRGPRNQPLSKYAKYAESQLEPGGKVAFTVFGNRSHNLYDTVAEAIADFEKYKALTGGNKTEKRDAISHFTIFRIPKRLKWQWRKPKKKSKRKAPTKKGPRK